MSPKSRQAAYVKKKKEMPSVSLRWMSWFIPVVLVAGLFFWVGDVINDPETLPVKKIRVHGAFVNVDEAMLHNAVSGVIAGGYFNIDVENVRKVVEQLPWVSKASVRRVWPDTLSVTVVEQKPVAVSVKYGLINKDGEVFKPRKPGAGKSLPVLDGEISSNTVMLSSYFEMNKLLESINKKITYLKLDARQAIELKLDNELKIVLGRENKILRLQRLIKIYEKVLAARINDIAAIDLRYTNGMAISWKKKTKGMPGDMKNV